MDIELKVHKLRVVLTWVVISIFRYLNRDIKDYLMDQCQWPRTSSLYGDERKSKKNKKRASQTSSGASDEVEVDYDEMEFRFLSDRLSGPLTIIHAMASLGDDIAAGVEVSRMRDLTVHIVGANVNEMLGIIKWEYLAHRLPALEKCRIVFIGPELAEQVKNSPFIIFRHEHANQY